MKKIDSKSIDKGKRADSPDRLPRKDSYYMRVNMHAGCWRGRIHSLYIYKNKKWLKIGEYCKKCGAVAIFSQYQKGLDKND